MIIIRNQDLKPFILVSIKFRRAVKHEYDRSQNRRSAQFEATLADNNMSDVADISDTYWESCNSYVRSFVTFDEQLQHRLPPQMVKLELLANRQLSTEQRSHYI